jgi:hypothetical protein
MKRLRVKIDTYELRNTLALDKTVAHNAVVELEIIASY